MNLRIMLLSRRYCSSFKRIAAITKNSTQAGDKIAVEGWIKNIRRLKNNIFVDLSDGSTAQKFQVVLPKNDHIHQITNGSSLKALGIIQVAPNGSFELHADEVELLAPGNVSNGYPFSPKQQHAPEYARDYLHLRSRVDYLAAQFRIRHTVQKVLHDVMDEQQFIHINTPILTTNDCEGAGEVFTVRPNSEQLLKKMQRAGIDEQEIYFGSKVFLTVSGQLHLEAMSFGLGNTYTLSPAFRAENSKSPLHLAEFYMFEAEMACDELTELTAFIESTIKSIAKRSMDRASGDIELCRKNANLKESLQIDWLHKPWTTLTFDEALEILEQNKAKFTTRLQAEQGFSKEQELFLVEHCQSPVFVIEWPTAQKPFYMRQLIDNPQRVAALDLLMPQVGELCGGSLREFNDERLRQHAQLADAKGKLDWYLELRKFGGIPTGGFGMGFERFLQLLTGVKNIRDVIPFPRYPHSCRM